MDGKPMSVNVSAVHDIFAGGGEMGELMRTLDWSQTPLGPAENWPQSLRTSVSICLASRFPMLIWWGPELVMLYNDAYRPILGATKHPQSMGQRGRDCWPEIWDIIGPMLEGVLTRGEATWSDNQMLPLARNGYVEECYFTFSYSPIRDETSGIGGIFTAVTETTGQVLGERRLHTLHELTERSAEAQSAEDVCFIAAETLAENAADIPFALFYLLQQHGIQAVRVGMYGLTPNTESCPLVIDIPQSENCFGPWSMAQVIRTGEPTLVSPLPEQLCFSTVQATTILPNAALVLPILQAGQCTPYGLLVAGISPLRDLDSDYRNFFGLVAEQIANAIAKARAYQEATERAELYRQAQAAISGRDEMISVVTHDLKNPLSTIKGFAQLLKRQVLKEGELNREQLAYGLTKIDTTTTTMVTLINELLSITRLQLGQSLELYREPTDLVELAHKTTAEYQRASERHTLRVESSVHEIIHEWDAMQLERVLGNLLSNAIKYSPHGGDILVKVGIDTSEDSTGSSATLSVHDHGIGIPAADIRYIFEQFRRAGNATGQFSGTGLGLASAHHIIEQHGGTLTVTSEEGTGSVFTIHLPLADEQG